MDENEQIPEGASVTVDGFTDEETGEALEPRAGVVLSAGHVVDGAPHYEIAVEGFDFPGLVAASRVTVT